MRILYAKYIFLILFVFLHQEGKSQEFLGKWYSKTIINETEVHYLFDIRQDGNNYIGYIDIPHDKKFRIQLDSIEILNNDKVLFCQRGLNLLFTGRLNRDNEEIHGIVKKDDYSNLLILSRQPQVKRNQIIEQPVPYHSKDIYFYNKDSTRLAGTITFPKEGDNLKAVVLISGSGPQDRNEEILGHQPFKILADYLTKQGMVVLRYDDRGYGQSEGQFRPATSMDYSYDALAAVQYLKTFDEVSIGKIGLIGHSEGGNIAPVVATMDSMVNFLILLAAPGTSNLKSYLNSLDLILKEYPETYNRDFPFFKSVYEDMARIKDKNILKDSLQSKFEKIATMMDDEELTVFGGVNNYVRSQVDYHSSDWYHYYLQFNVTEYLEELKIPILALNGDKDISVDAKFNLNGMESTLRASGNTKYEMIELKNVNHFFQVSTNHKIESVYFNEETFSRIALNKIANWIKRL